MKGWGAFCLDNIIHIKHGYAFKGEFFTEESTNSILLTPGNFSIGGGFKADKFKFYNGSIPPDYILNSGNIIVTMTDLSKQADTLGYSAKVPEIKGKRFLHNQRIGLVQLKDSNFYIEFLYWLMRTEAYQRYVAGSATGATVKHTSPTKICSYKFIAPINKHTQHNIASILSSYDDLIENNLKRIKLLEELAQRTYEEWFVKFRVNGVQLGVNEETGLPEGWGQEKLINVAHINQKSIKKGFNGKLKYVDISSVSTGKIDFFTEYEFKDAPGRARRIVTHGDIIWSCVRPNRKSYSIIWNPVDNLIASTGFAVITPYALPTSYLYQFLTTNSFVGYLTNLAGGAAYPAVTSAVFEESKIIIPSKEVVELFEKKFNPVNNLISNLINQYRHLKESRDILLPRLMSGQIEVQELMEEELLIAAEPKTLYKSK